MKEIQQDIWRLLEPLWWRPSHDDLMASNLNHRPTFGESNHLNFTDFYRNILNTL